MNENVIDKTAVEQLISDLKELETMTSTEILYYSGKKAHPGRGYNEAE